jgi:hypothetical protein
MREKLPLKLCRRNYLTRSGDGVESVDTTINWSTGVSPRWTEGAIRLCLISRTTIRSRRWFQSKEHV